MTLAQWQAELARLQAAAEVASRALGEAEKAEAAARRYTDEMRQFSKDSKRALMTHCFTVPE